MIYLSQRDQRWSQVKLGQSSLTVGRYGCTTTCISMLSDYFGCLVYPDAIAKNVYNYTKDGLVIWEALKFAKMRFAQRVQGRPSDSLIQACLKDPDKAIILQVDNGQHWVVALSKNFFGNDYTVLDPWTGKKCNAMSVYKNITNAAIFQRI